ncbi:MAG: carbamoyltransferase HypF, partial [Candidatus Omnitrophota bacterium]
MGRLFDAVASLILARHKADFEADLAIRIEKLATNYKLLIFNSLPARPAGKLRAISYEFKVIKNNDKYILDPAPMFKQIVLDLKARESKEKIAYRFHLTIAEMIGKTCSLLREETKINDILLSGGVFQNRLLLNLSLDLLYRREFKVLTHNMLPCNDSCISLGQVAIANYRG